MLPGCDGSRSADQGGLYASPHLPAWNLTLAYMHYGQVSAGLGFAYQGRPVVWIGSGTACSPDLPAAGNP